MDMRTFLFIPFVTASVILTAGCASTPVSGPTEDHNTQFRTSADPTDARDIAVHVLLEKTNRKVDLESETTLLLANAEYDIRPPTTVEFLPSSNGQSIVSLSDALPASEDNFILSELKAALPAATTAATGNAEVISLSTSTAALVAARELARRPLDGDFRMDVGELSSTIYTGWGVVSFEFAGPNKTRVAFHFDRTDKQSALDAQEIRSALRQAATQPAGD